MSLLHNLKQSSRLGIAVAVAAATVGIISHDWENGDGRPETTPVETEAAVGR